MRDKVINTFGGIKGYEIAQASNLIGLAISKVLLHNPYEQEEDIASIMELLVAYDLSEHYDTSIRITNYRFFKKYNLPDTLKIIQNAVSRGMLDRERWMPCLEVFFKKAKEFLEEVPEGYKD